VTAQWIREWGWIFIGAWMVAYVADYALTIAGARLYQGGVEKHLVGERGYELNPMFQKDVAELRRVSPRFVLWLLLSTAALAVLWVWIARPSDGSPGLYEFFAGWMLLEEVIICARGLANIYTFRFLRRSDGVVGRTEYAYWLSLRQAAAALVLMGTFPFALWAIVDASWFASGGATSCALSASRMFVRSRRARAEAMES